MKNTIKKQLLIWIISWAIFGCQSQVGLVERESINSFSTIQVSASRIGNITPATLFSIQAIQKAFPDYVIKQKMHSIEGEEYPVISVNQGSETLLIINPDLNKKHILSVMVENSKVIPYLGFTVGMKYSRIKTDIVTNRCLPGMEELSGFVICPAKSASNISYIFTGHWLGPDGELPPQHILNSWRLSKLVWTAMK